MGASEGQEREGNLKAISLLETTSALHLCCSRDQNVNMKGETTPASPLYRSDSYAMRWWEPGQQATSTSATNGDHT